MDFKEKHEFLQRSEECLRIRAKYPEKIPTIIQKGNKRAPEIDKNKFLIGKEFTMAGVLGTIRKRIRLSSEEALFMFVNNEVLVPHGFMTLAEIYEKHKDKDGFLYIYYSGE